MDICCLDYSAHELIQKGITPIRNVYPSNAATRIGRIFVIPHNSSGNGRVIDKVTQDEGDSVDMLHGPGEAFGASRLNGITVVDVQNRLATAWEQ
jgi:hypothetical protein